MRPGIAAAGATAARTEGAAALATAVASIRARFCHSNRRRIGVSAQLATPPQTTDQVRTLISLSGATCLKRAFETRFETFAYAISKHRFPLRGGVAALPAVNIHIPVRNCVQLEGKLSSRNRYYLLRRTVGWRCQRHRTTPLRPVAATQNEKAG